MKMEITYDKEADAMYIELRKGEFAKNRKINDLTIADLDREGNLLGIELLEVRKRTLSRSLPKIKLRNITAIA